MDDASMSGKAREGSSAKHPTGWNSRGGHALGGGEGCLPARPKGRGLSLIKALPVSLLSKGQATLLGVEAGRQNQGGRGGHCQGGLGIASLMMEGAGGTAAGY